MDDGERECLQCPHLSVEFEKECAAAIDNSAAAAAAAAFAQCWDTIALLEEWDEELLEWGNSLGT